MSTTGNITIPWGTTSTTGVIYVLEESMNSNFVGAIEVYRGANTSANLTGRLNGQYFYRVKCVKSGYGDSPWRVGDRGLTVSLQ